MATSDSLNRVFALPIAYSYLCFACAFALPSSAEKLVTVYRGVSFLKENDIRLLQLQRAELYRPPKHFMLKVLTNKIINPDSEAPRKTLVRHLRKRQFSQQCNTKIGIRMSLKEHFNNPPERRNLTQAFWYKYGSCNLETT